MSTYPSELNRYGASPGYDPYASGWDEATGTYRGAPPGGPIRPLRVGAATPYSAAQWLQLAPAKRGGFANRASYLKWWNRTVAPKLKKKAAGQTNRQNPQTGQVEATAAVDNSTLTTKDPRLLWIEKQIAEAERQKQGNAEAAGKIMAALASVQAAEPGQIRDAYQGAADRTVDYAQGMTGELGAQAGSAAQEAAAAIAAAGAPGTGIASESAAINNTLNYTGGFLPGTNLAAEAANQMTNALTSNKAAQGRLAELGMQRLKEEVASVNELRYKAIELQGTIEGENWKRELEEREMDLREHAQRTIDAQLKLSIAKTNYERADAMTEMTGTVWTVNKKGQLVNTGRPAPGSDAYGNVTSRTSQAATNKRLTEQEAAENSRIHVARSKVLGYAVDANGNEILRDGKRIPVNSEGQIAMTPAKRAETINKGRLNGPSVAKSVYQKVWNNMPKTGSSGTDGQRKNENEQQYKQRQARAQALFNRRLRNNRGAAMYAVMEKLAQLGYKEAGFSQAEIKAEAARYVDSIFPKG